MSRFRINAKNFFLTYPQSNELSNEKIRDFFTTKGAISYTISREQHRDGNYHHHALIEFGQPFSSRDERIFDIEGFHPNIQTARNMRNVRDYVKKAGNYISSQQDDTRTGKYEKLLGSTSREEFWGLAKREFARDVVLNYERLEYTAEKLFGETRNPYVSPFQGDPVLTSELEQWINEEFRKVCVVSMAASRPR